MQTKKVVVKKKGIERLTEAEQMMALFEDGDLDLSIEFIQFVKQLSKKHIIGPGFIGIDIRPKSDATIVNKLWNKYIAKQKKKEGKLSKKEWNKLINTKDKIVIVKRKSKPKVHREMVGIPPKLKVVNRIGYVFYYEFEKPKFVALVIKDAKTRKTLAEKRIPFPKVNIPFIPPEGAIEWFEANGGIDVLHFQ